MPTYQTYHIRRPIQYPCMEPVQAKVLPIGINLDPLGRVYALMLHPEGPRTEI